MWILACSFGGEHFAEVQCRQPLLGQGSTLGGALISLHLVQWKGLGGRGGGGKLLCCPQDSGAVGVGAANMTATRGKGEFALPNLAGSVGGGSLMILMWHVCYSCGDGEGCLCCSALPGLPYLCNWGLEDPTWLVSPAIEGKYRKKEKYQGGEWNTKL